MKTTLWQSEQKQLEVLIRLKEPQNCTQYFLNHFHGYPATITVDGEKIECILVSGVNPILAVRRCSGEIMLVRLSAVETVAVT